jgi:hypothetical protein
MIIRVASHKRPLAILMMSLLASFLLLNSATSLLPGQSPSAGAAYGATLGTITKTKSGLVASDPLTASSINTSYWFLYGDAVEQGAPYSYSEDQSGLHIGVQAAKSGQWGGFYAESPNSPANLYHAVLSVPFQTTPDHWWDTGLYVQTSSPKINYVTCAAVVSTAGITWTVVSTKGDSSQATEFNTLWTDTSVNQSYTRDCTIVTNGSNYLAVYLDNKLVYLSQSLDLQMPAPFNAYLEVQTSTASQELTGTYTDFYVTSKNTVKVSNAPAGSTVKIIDSSTNKILVKGTANSAGTVWLNIAKHHMPLSAYIKAYDPSGMLVASSSVMSIWGGDTYSVSSGAAAAITASATTDNTINSWNKKVKRHELPERLYK